MARSRPRRKIKVYYDGQCAMCTAIIGSVRDSRQRGTFDLRDMHRDPSMPFDKAMVAKEIHVIDEEGQVHRGAAAVFRIAAQFRHLSLLSVVGELAPIRPIATLGYRVVAANRRFLFGPLSRIFWMKAAVLIAVSLGLMLSTPLWIGPRTYPLTPIVPIVPTLGHPFDEILFGSLFGLAGAAAIFPRPQKFIAAFLLVLAVFCVFDQTRWQSWIYLYSFMLAALALFSWRSEDDVGCRNSLDTIRLIVAGTYLFSGLQKINWNFVQYEFLQLVQPITEIFPTAARPLYVFGMLAPFIQVGFAIGLLTRRFRRLSLVVAVSMHMFILSMLGPFGQNWNTIVWPWTAAMAIFDILLFSGSQVSTWRAIVRFDRGYSHATMLALFLIMPLLSFVNRWDSYLSAALYSGNTTNATVYFSDAGAQALPMSVRRYVVHTSADTNMLNLQYWAVEEMNVLPYPETRVYRAIARTVCGWMTKPDSMVMLVREQRMFYSAPETGYRCDQL